jgi:hypothetical protein
MRCRRSTSWRRSSPVCKQTCPIHKRVCEYAAHPNKTTQTRTGKVLRRELTHGHMQNFAGVCEWRQTIDSVEGFQ